MPAKMGRPTNNKKTERLEIRLTPEEAKDLSECSELLNVTRTAVINKGIQLVKAELNRK